MTKNQIREALNRFDHQALDEDTQYFDLLTLYEALDPKLTTDDQLTLRKLVNQKDPEKINAYMSNIAERDLLKSNKPLNTLKEEEIITDDLDLNKIYEEEALEEGRNNLKPVKCKAILSGKSYYSPFDTKIGAFAQYGTRFRYDTKQACQDAINDPSKDLGYEKGGKSAVNVQLAKEADEPVALTEDTYAACEGGPFIVQVYHDFKAGKLRVLGDDGVHGIHQVAFPTKFRTGDDHLYKVSKMGWNGKNYRVGINDVLDRLTGVAEVGPVSVGAKEEPQQALGRSRTRTASERKLQLEKMKNSNNKILNEVNLTTEKGDIEQPVYINFNGIKVNPKDLSDEMYAVMFKTPIKANGELKDAAMVLVKLYEQCIVNGLPYVKREELLRISGVPNPERAGDHSTWFNNFGQLDLANLRQGYVYPGSNLKDWIEGNCPYQYTDASGKPIGHFKRDGSWEEHPTSGNPYGLNLRPYVTAYAGKNFKQRADQGVQLDRSHGYGDTKMSTGSVEPVAAERSRSRSRSRGTAERKLQMESVDLYKPDWSNLENETSKQMRSIYRKEYNLTEDAEIEAPSFSDYKEDRKFSNICLKHNWPIDYARKYLFGEEI